MALYRIKHKATGLYYKPGKSNLSKFGKVYSTGNNVLNYYGWDYIPIVSNKRALIKKLEDLEYETKWIRYAADADVCFKIPKSEFEIEYLTDNKREK